MEGAEVAEPGEAGGQAGEREKEQGAAVEGAEFGNYAVGEAGCAGCCNFRTATAKTMAQANTTTTLVRRAMARFESTCATPTLAKRAVAAAKIAESIAHAIQLMGNMVQQPGARLLSRPIICIRFSTLAPGKSARIGHGRFVG